MLNIVVSVNGKYIEPLKTMLFSLKNHTKSDILVWLLNRSLKPEDIIGLQKYLKKYDMEIRVIQIKASKIDELPLIDDKLFSIEIYYRLLIPWILPSEIERALWLDADIAINGDICSFYYTDFKGKCLLACADDRQFIPKAREQDGERLQLNKTHSYFNSGVLLMNLNQIRLTMKMDDIFKAAELLNNRLRLPDQDLLNYLFQNSVIYENAHYYNCSRNMYKSLNKDERNQIKIIHYYCARKPWHKDAHSDLDMVYWKIQWAQGKIVVFPFVRYYLHQKFSKVKWVKNMYRLIFPK